MIPALPIATATLAILSDDEEASLDDVLTKAILTQEAKLLFDEVLARGGTKEDLFQIARKLLAWATTRQPGDRDPEVWIQASRNLPWAMRDRIEFTSDFIDLLRYPPLQDPIVEVDIEWVKKVPVARARFLGSPWISDTAIFDPWTLHKDTLYGQRQRQRHERQRLGRDRAVVTGATYAIAHATKVILDELGPLVLSDLYVNSPKEEKTNRTLVFLETFDEIMAILFLEITSKNNITKPVGRNPYLIGESIGKTLVEWLRLHGLYTDDVYLCLKRAPFNFDDNNLAPWAQPPP